MAKRDDPNRYRVSRDVAAAHATVDPLIKNLAGLLPNVGLLRCHVLTAPYLAPVGFRF